MTTFTVKILLLDLSVINTGDIGSFKLTPTAKHKCLKVRSKEDIWINRFDRLDLANIISQKTTTATMNPVLIFSLSAFIIYNAQALPVSELAGMHQLDEKIPALIEADHNNKTDSEICKGQPEGTILADPEDNTSFFECSNNRAFKFHCPDGLVFNSARKVCDYDPNGPTVHPPINITSKFDCRNKKDGFYPDEKDHHKFHECVNGYPYDFECPPKTIFDPSKNACAYEQPQQTLASEQEKVIVEEKEDAKKQDDDDDDGPLETESPKSKRSPLKQLEELAEVKHIDLHKVETTTPEKFDIWID